MNEAMATEAVARRGWVTSSAARDMTASAASTTDVMGLPSPCGDGDHHIDHIAW